MIVLDTNVISELMRPPLERAPSVVAWLRGWRIEEVYTTAPCIGEILAGVRMLPEGRRRSDLEEGAQLAFATVFAGRVLPSMSQRRTPTPISSRPAASEVAR